MASICKYRTKRGFAYRVESRPDKLFLRGFSYRPAAAIAKGHVERLFELHRAGRRPTGDLAAWCSSLPDADRQKLVKASFGVYVAVHLKATPRKIMDLWASARSPWSSGIPGASGSARHHGARAGPGSRSPTDREGDGHLERQAGYNSPADATP